MKNSITGIIPQQFRGRAVVVSVTIFVRALLNFVGLAMLVPALLLILDSDSIHSTPFISRIYEALGFESDTTFTACACAVIFGVIVLKCVANLLLYRVERNFIYKLYTYLSRNLYIDYYNKGLQFIKSYNSAVLARNINVVCYTFVAGVLRPVASLLSETALLAMLFIAILAYSPMAALLSVCIFAPAVWLYFKLIKQRIVRYGRAENDAQRAKTRSVIDSLRGYSDIEINNAFGNMLRQFDASMQTIVEVGQRNATVSTLPQMFTEIGIVFGLVLMVLVGAGTGSGNIKIMFGIFAIAALRLMPSVRIIMSAWTTLRYNRYTIDIIADAKIHTAEPLCTVGEQLSMLDSIELRDLTFRFDDSDHDTLHALSLTIHKGEHIGIRGRSGAGKTTLFNLMLGLYRPTAGEILIDGSPLDSDRVIRLWQNSIGYVSQSVFLTDSTIIENIALGTPVEQIDRRRAEEAIDAASLREFVDALPSGMDTRIGECGSLISGGQRQRIGIARALYKRASVLFFDEATSSLDTTTEHSINEAVSMLSSRDKELTIIVIAHRESSLAYCDRIIDIE